jgi:hypothetical protein
MTKNKKYYSKFYYQFANFIAVLARGLAIIHFNKMFLISQENAKTHPAVRVQNFILFLLLS